MPKTRAFFAAVFILAVLGVIVWAALSVQRSAAAPVFAPAHTNPTVVIGGQTVAVTIADTDASREKGLGGRTGLSDHEGMLFVFPQDGYYAFWMKDMQFSIDIVWIAADGTVVYIEPNLSPSTYPTAFEPTKTARYVLELPAGFMQRYNVTIGNKATLPSSL